MLNINPEDKDASIEYAARVFRDPLTTIIGTLDLMREGVYNKMDETQKKRLLEKAYNKAQKMNAYLNYCICDDEHCLDNTCKIHFPKKA